MDLSIRMHHVDGFGHIISHLQRFHTLCQDDASELIPLSKQMQELLKLRHLYVKALV